MKYPDSVLIWIHIFTLCVAKETAKLEGDIIIGGLFKIFDLKDGACSNTVDTASVRDYEAVKWTLKKLNAASYIPGINIGIEAFSTCDIPGRAVYHTVNFVQKAFENHANSSSLPIVGILGPETSSEAEETSAFLSSLSKEYQLYQFLFSATSSNLNDERLSNILRVIPSDTIQTKVMQHFLKQLEWNYVAVVYENTTYGRTAFEELSSSAKSEGICIAKSFPIKIGISVDFSALQTVLDNLLSNAESQITGVIFFVSTTTASDFLSIVQGRKQGSFFRLMMVFSESIALERSMLKKYVSVSKGTFVTSPPVLEVKEFSTHWNNILSNKTSFLNEYVTNPWLLNVLRKYISCDPFQETCLMPTLQEVSTSENENIFEGYAIVATLLQVSGIKELHLEKCKGSDGICTELRETLHKHKNMLFKKSSREVIFQDVPFHFEKNFSIILNGKNEVLMNRNISAYEVYQYRRCLDKNEDFCLEKVADYGENSLKVLTGRLVDYSDNNDEIQWPNMYKAQCSPGRNCKSCKVENAENDIYFQNGDFFIIGMAPVNSGDLSNPLHCGVIRESNGWECTEAISYAVDEINQNKDVFPNSTIGFIILNSCNQPVLTSKKLLNIMNNGVTLTNGTVVHDVSSRVLGVVAELGSSISQAAAKVLQEFNIVQVAYGSTAAVLSDREEYKYFLRLSTPDTNQAMAMVDISKKLNLTYIQILFSEGTYGEGGRDDIIRAAKSLKVCVANEIIVQENKYSKVLDDLRRNPYAKVVLLFLKSHVVSEVIEVITRSMDAEEFVFIASEAFGTRTEIIENNPKLENSLSLSLEIPLNGNNLKGYIYSKSTEKYYLNPWTRSFLEKKNACFLPGSFDKSSNKQCEKVFDRYNSSDIKYDIWSPFALHAAKVVLNGAYAAFRHICGLNSKTICSEYRDNPKLVWKDFQQQKFSVNSVQTSIFDDNGDGNLGHVIYQIKKSSTDPKVLEFVKNTSDKKPSHMYSCQSGAGDVLPWRGQVQLKDQCTQTKEITESFDVKIIANYAGNERSKIIREDNLKSALKALLNNSSPRAVLKHFQANNLYKTEMLHLVEKELNLEVIELLKHTEIELFQGHASNNEKLLQFDWKQKEESLKNKAPFFHEILRTVLNPKQKKDKQFIPQMMTAAAVLLYGRSQRQNQLQYILGLVLDKCGLTKEVGSFSQSTKLNLSRIDTINPTKCPNQKCEDYCTLFYNGNAKDEKETSNDNSNTGVVVGLSVVAAIFVFITIALIIYILIIRRGLLKLIQSEEHYVDPTEFSVRNEYLTVVK